MEKVKDVAKDTVEVVGDVTMKVVEVVEEVVVEVRRSRRDTVLYVVWVWRSAPVADVRAAAPSSRRRGCQDYCGYLAAVLAPECLQYLPVP